ncbi:PepSY domain-containing protein [Spirulina subsalsa]|uniref:PepSY domain-containing protein n=1 Tax=Spirulina subsalsa TaxID=54311 RepID=UPI0002FBF5F7|nr:PepSY domain-containing protein [Spirulina subsalsa]
MNKRLFRQLHRTLAPIIILPFLITALTGISYRLGKSWLGLSRDQVHWLMTIHEGEYLGPILEPIYVLLNGLGVLFMIGTGTYMVIQSWQPQRWFRPRQKQEEGKNS